MIGEWCNGSTTDSDSVCLGSNPSSPASVINDLDDIFKLNLPRNFIRNTMGSDGTSQGVARSCRRSNEHNARSFSVSTRLADQTGQTVQAQSDQPTADEFRDRRGCGELRDLDPIRSVQEQRDDRDWRYYASLGQYRRDEQGAGRERRIARHDSSKPAGASRFSGWIGPD
jgi:hypothetical protein